MTNRARRAVELYGDDESITSLRDDGLIPCSNPTEIECRTIDGIPWDEAGQTLATQCTIDGGLVCLNEDNPVRLGRRFGRRPPFCEGLFCLVLKSFVE